MKIHLFNPENDLALGLGCRHYTPPPHAAAIHRAGALLPMWWAEKGDLILAPEDLREDAEMLAGRFGINGTVCQDTAAIKGIEKAVPWGWSHDAKRQFLKAGISEEILPPDKAVDRMRELSHRRMSVEIIKTLGQDYPIAIETTDPDHVVELERHSPGCFIKSPWSGSGRGVFCARSLSEGALRRRAEGIIHRQVSVMVERGLDKVMDFAALFHCDGKGVRYGGLSVFATEARGMYSGNLVAPQPILWEEIGKHVDTERLRELIREEERILGTLIGNDYSGWMGVDMMIYRDNDGQKKIMPCVELNLRMTMGVVALKIADRLKVTDRRFLAWEHNTTVGKDGLILLPPSDGFTLRLSDARDVTKVIDSR